MNHFSWYSPSCASDPSFLVSPHGPLPDPEVVRVEELVLRHVLKRLLVFLGTLRRLAKNVLVICLAHGKMATLLVALRSGA